jgi:hypothetical protein
MREVKRTEEMERQLRYFHSQMHAYNELAPKEGKEPLILAPAPSDVRHLQLDDLAVRSGRWAAPPRDGQESSNSDFFSSFSCAWSTFFFLFFFWICVHLECSLVLL